MMHSFYACCIFYPNIIPTSYQDKKKRKDQSPSLQTVDLLFYQGDIWLLLPYYRKQNCFIFRKPSISLLAIGGLHKAVICNLNLISNFISPKIKINVRRDSLYHTSFPSEIYFFLRSPVIQFLSK